MPSLLGNDIFSVVTEGFEAPATVICHGFRINAIAAVDAIIASTPSNTTERIVELNSSIQ